MPHPPLFESKKGANLCSVSLEPRNGKMKKNGKWEATFRLVRTTGSHYPAIRDFVFENKREEGPIAGYALGCLPFDRKFRKLRMELR